MCTSSGRRDSPRCTTCGTTTGMQEKVICDRCHSLGFGKDQMHTATITEKSQSHAVNKANEPLKLSWRSLDSSKKSHWELGEQKLSNIYRARKWQYKINFSNLVAFLVQMLLQPHVKKQFFSLFLDLYLRNMLWHYLT